MDAILSLGVTQLVDRILELKQISHPAACDTGPLPTKSLAPTQVRDVLLLTACYDQSTAETSAVRWRRLRASGFFHVAVEMGCHPRHAGHRGRVRRSSGWNRRPQHLVLATEALALSGRSRRLAAPIRPTGPVALACPIDCPQHAVLSKTPACCGGS